MNTLERLQNLRNHPDRIETDCGMDGLLTILIDHFEREQQSPAPEPAPVGSVGEKIERLLALGWTLEKRHGQYLLEAPFMPGKQGHSAIGPSLEFALDAALAKELKS